MKLLRDRILVKQDGKEKVTSGGIIIEDSIEDQFKRGTVVEVGEGVMLDDGTRAPMSISKGDTVVFGRHAGIELSVDLKPYLVIFEEDVIGVE